MPSKTLYRNADSTKHVLFVHTLDTGGKHVNRWLNGRPELTKVTDNEEELGVSLFGANTLTNAGVVENLKDIYSNLRVVTIKRNPYNKFIETLAYLNLRDNKTFTPDQLLTTDDMTLNENACWYCQCGHLNFGESPDDEVSDVCPRKIKKWLYFKQSDQTFNNSTPCCDEYLSYENFVTEFGTFCQSHLGIDTTGLFAASWPPTRWNDIQVGDTDGTVAAELTRILDTVTESTKTKIYNKFQDDFTKLGYASTDWTY